MRITGGTARGRSLRAPKGLRVRPTADKVRAAIFNILAARSVIEGRAVLDLFAGTGALGLEALSRGAERVTFVDESRESCHVAADNVRRSGFEDQCRIIRLELPGGVRRLTGERPQYSGVFLDPPYHRGLAERTLDAIGAEVLLEPKAWAVAEHAADEPLRERYGRLVLRDTRRYGSTAISFFEVEAG